MESAVSNVPKIIREPSSAGRELESVTPIVPPRTGSG